MLVLRGQGLFPGLEDTDPQRTGLPPHPVRPASEEGRGTADMVQGLLEQVRYILSDEPVANGFLARGFAGYEPYPSYLDRYGLKAAGCAKYPMYRGVARLAGMAIPDVPSSTEDTVTLVERIAADYDFVFVHFKDTDSYGHDGDFEGKVAAIEEVDALLPRFTALDPAALVVTGDHSTPTLYREHSWHHVPLLIASKWGRPSAKSFGETECRAGDLGVVRGKDLMALALAHAARLDKYGA